MQSSKTKKNFLSLTYSYIWWCRSNCECIGSLEYYFIAINPRSTLIQTDMNIKVPRVSSMDMFEKYSNFIRPGPKKFKKHLRKKM